MQQIRDPADNGEPLQPYRWVVLDWTCWAEYGRSACTPYGRAYCRGGRGVEAAILSSPMAGTTSEHTICIISTRRTGALDDAGDTTSDGAW
jgi:hypothetical protein